MEIASIYLLNFYHNTKANQLAHDNQKASHSLTSLKSRILDEDIKARDNDGTLQSIYEVLIEMKRREKIEKWPCYKTTQSTLRHEPVSNKTGSS